MIFLREIYRKFYYTFPDMTRWKIAAILCATLRLHGLYQGNPSMPEIIDDGFFLSKDSFMAVRVGYQHDQVWNRSLKSTGQISGHVGQVAQRYDQGVLTLNFMDRFDVFGSAGAMEISVSDREKIDSLPYQFAYHTHYNFTWGAGIRASIINWCDTSLGASANFQYATPKMSWNTIEGITFPNTARINWVEWQIGIGVSHQIDMFIPYIGMNYSKVLAEIYDIGREILVPSYPSKLKMRSRNWFGLALGCDLSTGRLFDLGIEARLISEQSFTIKGDIKF